MAVSAEGDVWVELGSSRKWSVIRLGRASVSETLGRKEPWRLGLTSDGAPAVKSAGGIRVLEGVAWAKEPGLTDYEWCVLGWYLTSTVGADGGCRSPGGEFAALVRIDADGTETGVNRPKMGLELDQGVGPLFVTPDLVIRATVGHASGNVNGFDGVVAYDGSTWSVIPYASEDFDLNASPIAVDADGGVGGWLSDIWDSRQLDLGWGVVAVPSDRSGLRFPPGPALAERHRL